MKTREFKCLPACCAGVLACLRRKRRLRSMADGTAAHVPRRAERSRTM